MMMSDEDDVDDDDYDREIISFLIKKMGVEVG